MLLVSAVYWSITWGKQSRFLYCNTSWYFYNVNLHCPSTGNWIKDLLNMALPIRTRPRFPLSQSLPSGSFHKSLIFLQTDEKNHQKLSKLITWTTALSNSMKLWAMPCRATQERRVTVEACDRTWSTGEGNGKPFQYSCLENTMKSIKR